MKIFPRFNEHVDELGLKYSNFTNSTGWPDENHYMTASDLAVLSSRIIKDFPEFFHLFMEKVLNIIIFLKIIETPCFILTNLLMVSRLVIQKHLGILLLPAYKNKRRLILIVSGLKNEKEERRNKKLFEWAYKNFTNIRLFKKTM